jgi:Glycosyl Hydrolase Family 88
MKPLLSGSAANILTRRSFVQMAVVSTAAASLSRLTPTGRAADVGKSPDDGLWRPNMADPLQIPVPETSGTGFFCFGLAWGINNGLLDRPTYEPVARKAWAGLVANVSEEGQVLSGQNVGDRPAELKREHSHEYVTGAFLLAASQMYQLADGRPADAKGGQSG